MTDKDEGLQVPRAVLDDALLRELQAKDEHIKELRASMKFVYQLYNGGDPYIAHRYFSSLQKAKDVVFGPWRDLTNGYWQNPEHGGPWYIKRIKVE